MRIGNRVELWISHLMAHVSLFHDVQATDMSDLFSVSKDKSLQVLDINSQKQFYKLDKAHA